MFYLCNRLLSVKVFSIGFKLTGKSIPLYLMSVHLYIFYIILVSVSLYFMYAMTLIICQEALRKTTLCFMNELVLFRYKLFCMVEAFSAYMWPTKGTYVISY